MDSPPGLDAIETALADLAAAVADTNPADFAPAAGGRQHQRVQVNGMKRSLVELQRFVAAVDDVTKGRPPVTCADCGERFHSLRSDARYCSSTCRSRTSRRNR